MKKKLATLLVVLTCAACVLCACSTNGTANSGRKINSINHRGYVDAPENTLSAFRLSAKMGFSMVECDVSFTKDSVPVLLHDKTVNRTSNGKGSIRELTFEQVRQYDFGSWTGKEYAGELIPSFSEFLTLCAELSLYPYVEVKGGATESEVAILAQLVQEADLDVTWISFEYEILSQLVEIFPNGRFGYLVHFVTDAVLEQIATLTTPDNEVFADCYYLTLSDWQLQRCKDNAVPVEVWTLNNKKRIAQLDPYVSGVTSDSFNAESIFAEL